MLRPFYLLLRDTVDFKWTPHLEQTFLDLKSKIKQGELKLALPNPHKRFYILTDASNYGIGAALLQESTTSSHKMDMISANSRLFSVHELRLSTILHLRTPRIRISYSLIHTPRHLVHRP